ncbi:metallophosphoesterase [Curtobacterium flaccumfaciens]|nr:metallophosphoesterase [Curtobacterium flaccumfaciens]
MQPPAAGTLRILHLSDTHLTGDGALHQGAVDTTVALERLLAHVDDVPGIGLVVVSGDVSEDGSPESYATVRDRVGGWAQRHGAALVAVPGNHDLREGFRQVLTNGHVLGEGGAALVHTMEYLPPTVPVSGQSVVAGCRIVTVDTSVPGAGYGELSDTALEHLRTALADADGATDAPHGTVVVLHHPPLPAPTELHEALRLQNPEALADVIRGSDVRVVLGGHYHHHFAGSLAGVPVPRRPRRRERHRRRRPLRRRVRRRRQRRTRRRRRRGRLHLVDTGPRAARRRRLTGLPPRRRDGPVRHRGRRQALIRAPAGAAPGRCVRCTRVRTDGRPVAGAATGLPSVVWSRPQPRYPASSGCMREHRVARTHT